MKVVCNVDVDLPHENCPKLVLLHKTLVNSTAVVFSVVLFGLERLSTFADAHFGGGVLNVY
jgi:hypothetical protein